METPGRYERESDKKNQMGYCMDTEKRPCMLSEAGMQYVTGKRAGEYTLEDYYALPDDERAELIDGSFFRMEAPSTIHQMVVFEVCYQIRSYIGRRGGKCVPFIAPVDVQLDCDDRTMVEPDVIIVCDRNKIIKRCIYGAPDFIVEVLSDSTAKRDTGIKPVKYRNAGVREYWIVDVNRKRILVYEFYKGDVPALYGMNAKIPIGIFEGDCVIDFAPIYERVKDIPGFE